MRHHPLRFIWRVLVSFRANQGIILSGAVAFYILLSIIPFFTLVLVALSHVVEEHQLLHILDNYLRMLVPGLSDILLEHAETFLEYRHAVSWIGIGLMLFFSSMAFTVLENTISLIFFHRVQTKRRHFMVSAIIPYIYIMLLGLGILLLTAFSGTLHLMDNTPVTLFSWTRHLGTLGEIGMHAVGIAGMIVLLTSFYTVMPPTRVSLRNALVGGTAAALLWEIARNVLIWYFETLSMVNVIYGSLAAVIVALLFLEVAGMILLLGAQVVAEFERLENGAPARFDIRRQRHDS